VKVHYAGTLIDGTKFDSSYDRKEPATFGVNQVISGIFPSARLSVPGALMLSAIGWTEILQLMVIGDKFEVYIPYDKAYGTSGSPPKIPGYSTYDF